MNVEIVADRETTTAREDSNDMSKYIQKIEITKAVKDKIRIAVFISRLEFCWNDKESLINKSLYDNFSKSNISVDISSKYPASAARITKWWQY